MQMTAVRVATLLCALIAGTAFGADKPPCELLTRPQVATVVGDGAIATQYVAEQLPQRRSKGKELAIHVCGWFVKEAQSAVEVRLATAPTDAEAALATLGAHGRKRQDDEQAFGPVSCWSEAAPKEQFPNAACVGNVKGNALKVEFRSNTAMPTIQEAKALFDQAAAGL